MARVRTRWTHVSSSHLLSWQTLRGPRTRPSRIRPCSLHASSTHRWTVEFLAATIVQTSFDARGEHDALPTVPAICALAQYSTHCFSIACSSMHCTPTPDAGRPSPQPHRSITAAAEGELTYWRRACRPHPHIDRCTRPCRGDRLLALGIARRRAKSPPVCRSRQQSAAPDGLFVLPSRLGAASRASQAQLG